MLGNETVMGFGQDPISFCEISSFNDSGFTTIPTSQLFIANVRYPFENARM